MTVDVSPGLTLIVGAALLPLLPARLRGAYAVLLPLLGLLQLALLTPGVHGQVDYLGLQLVMLRVDRWSILFGCIFLIAAALSGLYALHVRKASQQVAALVYAGAAIGAVFAGDLLTLFVYWEITAISSLLLVWARGTAASYGAGMRYFAVHLLSGLLLLLGAVAHHRATGSLHFDHVGLSGLSGWLIFGAFGIKAAFPLLHSWLPDAYPQATETGTVYLSAFTTKLAVYALARGYAGTELLIPIGAAMAVFPIYFALVENDLRRVLAHSLNSQLGFMVVGIGIGTELSLNGAAAHAVASTLYQALLFMAMGAVLHRVGTARASELGGLHRSMPVTMAFCLVGAASISAMPLFSGFVTKSMILSSAGAGGHVGVWTLLMIASVGAWLHTGLKVPYGAFFGPRRAPPGDEAPRHMLLAMGLVALLCVGIGVCPAPLYEMLPYPVDYVPYTASHVLAQLQLLAFGAAAFGLLLRWRLYPLALGSTHLDIDWLYRRLLPGAWAWVRRVGGAADLALRASAVGAARAFEHRVAAGAGRDGNAARTRGMAMWVLVLLLGYLLLYNL